MRRKWHACRLAYADGNHRQQLDVPQGEVFDLAANALRRRRLRKTSEEDFFTEVFSQLPLDMSRYGGMLYFDVLAFGLYTQNGKKRCRYSAFTEALEKELGLSHDRESICAE